MNKGIAATLKSRFSEFARGAGLPRGHHDFGSALQAAIREGLTSKKEIAESMGVEEPHVFKKANGLKPSEIRDVCQKLAM